MGSVNELTIQLEKGNNSAEGKDRLDHLVQELVKSQRSDEQVIEALCLATLSRLPTDEEKKFITDYLTKQKDRQEALTNVLWVFTNSKEFGVNVVGAHQSIVWDALRRCGVDDRIEGFGRLFREF